MYCPFLKRIDYYDRYNFYTEKLKAAIQEETFCNCKQEQCMAYNPNTCYPSDRCKLIKKEN